MSDSLIKEENTEFTCQGVLRFLSSFPFTLNCSDLTVISRSPSLRNSISASAVCAFNLSSITQAFNGPFRYQENPRTAWLSTPNPIPNFQVIHIYTEKNTGSEPQTCVFLSVISQPFPPRLMKVSETLNTFHL